MCASLEKLSLLVKVSYCFPLAKSDLSLLTKRLKDHYMVWLSKATVYFTVLRASITNYMGLKIAAAAPTSATYWNHQ